MERIQVLPRARRSPTDTLAKWPDGGTIFGYRRNSPDYVDQRLISGCGSHRVVFNSDVLREMKEASGFEDIRDEAALERCHHSAAWAAFIEDLRLEVAAKKPAPHDSGDSLQGGRLHGGRT